MPTPVVIGDSGLRAASPRGGVFWTPRNAAFWIALFELVAIAATGPANVAHAEAPRRVVSINACTDQLLLALADRGQIEAVTRYVDDDTMSFYRSRAGGIRRIAGNAEEVLKIRPDLVLAGSFTRRETRERLKAFGLRVELVPPVRTIEDVRAIVTKTADMLGQPETGRKVLADIDASLARIEKVARGLRVLHLQRRGFVAGSGTLVDDLLIRLGASNVAGDLGIKRVSRASLEAIVKARPDALVLFARDGDGGDQGSALLAHPSLSRIVPPERWISIDMNQVICGGPQIVAAIDSLSASLARIAALK